LDGKEIALRLFLTLIAGVLIGINRGEHGRPAGLRTTLLVCLAASVAMIQTNLLLLTTGKSHDSFITLDLMRLPLGILSGMGFIGGGAILKKGDLILGVTTAATLWFVTVVGLCFGGGQIGLGLAALALGLFVLAGLKHLEKRLPQDHFGSLILNIAWDGPSEAQLRTQVEAAGYKVLSVGADYEPPQKRIISFTLRYRKSGEGNEQPGFLASLLENSQITGVKWEPRGSQAGPS
jgi:putative Mg2+ transporter-C (MgtC) family protein